MGIAIVYLLQQMVFVARLVFSTNKLPHPRYSLKLKGYGGIVAKKRDPGILDPELFLAQIRKVEARLGKLAKIRKSVIN